MRHWRALLEEWRMGLTESEGGESGVLLVESKVGSAQSMHEK
jgi:hypothetical protein